MLGTHVTRIVCGFGAVAHVLLAFGYGLQGNQFMLGLSCLFSGFTALVALDAHVRLKENRPH